MLSTVIPPVAEPVSLAQAKAELRISHDDAEENALLEMRISAAREMIEAYCGRAFAAQRLALVDHVAPDGRVRLFRPPVSGIFSVESIADDGGLTAIAEDHWALDANSDRWAEISIRDGSDRVRITYDVEPGTVPASIRQGVLKLVAIWHIERSECTGAIPDAVKAIIRPHRLVAQ